LYSSLAIAANFILNWYQDLWKIPSKPGGKLDGLAISFILLQVFVGIPLVPYALLHWHSENVLRFACFSEWHWLLRYLKFVFPALKRQCPPISYSF